MYNYNIEVKKMEEKIKKEVLEAFDLWELVEEHEALVAKDDIYKLAILEDKVKYYQSKGILVYHEDTPLLERIKDDSFLRVGNDFPEAPLRLSFLDHPHFDRTGMSLDQWREFRLSHDKGSLLFRLTLSKRNAALRGKIQEETTLIKRLFQDEKNQTDKVLDEYALTKCKEKLLPLIKEREELHEIIRREMGFDYTDLKRLSELEKMRDKLFELESNKARFDFLERYDEFRPEMFKDLYASRKEIDYMLSRIEKEKEKENGKKDNDKIFNLQYYLENAKKMRFNSDKDKNERIPEERATAAVNARVR